MYIHTILYFDINLRYKNILCTQKIKQSHSTKYYDIKCMYEIEPLKINFHILQSSNKLLKLKYREMFIPNTLI